MEKYRRYYGVIIFVVTVFVLVMLSFKIIQPKIENLRNLNSSIETKEKELQGLQTKLTIVKNKIKKIRDSVAGSQKKIYSPIESDLGNDTLFFTLYNDVMEMLHANSIKIKSIDYTYNPESDEFVKFGKDIYFVCDVNMELISNYVNLGKLIQDIYQYPYYIKINNLTVKPYEKDKKILITNLTLRLYAHTSADTESDDIEEKPISTNSNP